MTIFATNPEYLPSAAPKETLQGRTALVTGAGRGLGRFIALSLAEHGSDLILTSAKHETLLESARLARAFGVSVETHAVDLAHEGERASLIARVHDKADILVNNAAAPPGTASCTGDILAEVNLAAPVQLTEACLPVMIARGWGRIASISCSIVDQVRFRPIFEPFVTAKEELEEYTLGVSSRIDGSGVTANVFRPWYVDTATQALFRQESTGSAESRSYFRSLYDNGQLIPPATAAKQIIDRLGGLSNGVTWNSAPDT